MRLDRYSWSFLILLGLLSGLPALSIDLSAPTLVLLPDALGTTTTTAGLTLSLFMVGFAAGQFAGGRSSDQVGRRPVLLIALALYMVGGVLCALATTGPGLAGARLIQGAAAGGCSVQPAAIVQDLFRGEAARRKQSFITGVFTILPMLAPAFGTFMVAHWGWRSVHSALAVAGGVLLLVALTLLPESRTQDSSDDASSSVETPKQLANIDFVRLCAVNALSYGALFAYIAGGPLVVMGLMGYPGWVYAALFATTAMALSAGSWGSVAFGRKGLGACAMIQPAVVIFAACGLALAAVWAANPQANLVAFLAIMIPLSASRGVLSPNLVYLGLSSRRSRTGIASAVIGFSQLVVGAVASAVVAELLPRFGVLGLTLPMAFLASAAALLWLPAASRFQRAENTFPA